jgi:hypothetical protein
MPIPSILERTVARQVSEDNWIKGQTDWPYKQTFDGEYAGDTKVMEVSTQKGCKVPYDGEISADYCK